MLSEKVDLLNRGLASHFGQIWPRLSMWVKGVASTRQTEVNLTGRLENDGHFLTGR
jgi:hypothetical protein